MPEDEDVPREDRGDENDSDGAEGSGQEPDDEDDGSVEAEDLEEEDDAAAPSSSQLPARRQQQNRGEALASAISVKARLPPCNIGAIELLTFFPHHVHWPEAGLRLYRNGWSTSEIARIQLHARGKLTKARYHKQADLLKHLVLKSGRIFFNKEDFTPTDDAQDDAPLMTPVASYDATNYVPKINIANELNDESLLVIAQGVVNWPTGQDRGIVSQAIEHAVQGGLRQFTTADIPQLTQQLGFVQSNEVAGGQWDQNARQRVDNIAARVKAIPH